MNTSPRRPLSRRTFLRAAGISMALPFLDSMLGRALGQGAGEAAAPRRMICVCAGFGFHAPFFFPKAAGRAYEATPYLEKLQKHRDDFTVISGLSQIGSESAGHNAE